MTSPEETPTRYVKRKIKNAERLSFADRKHSFDSIAELPTYKECVLQTKRTLKTVLARDFHTRKLARGRWLARLFD